MSHDELGATPLKPRIEDPLKALCAPTSPQVLKFKGSKGGNPFKYHFQGAAFAYYPNQRARVLFLSRSSPSGQLFVGQIPDDHSKRFGMKTWNLPHTHWHPGGIQAANRYLCVPYHEEIEFYDVGRLIDKGEPVMPVYVPSTRLHNGRYTGAHFGAGFAETKHGETGTPCYLIALLRGRRILDLYLGFLGHSEKHPNGRFSCRLIRNADESKTYSWNDDPEHDDRHDWHPNATWNPQTENIQLVVDTHGRIWLFALTTQNDNKDNVLDIYEIEVDWTDGNERLNRLVKRDSRAYFRCDGSFRNGAGLTLSTDGKRLGIISSCYDMGTMSHHGSLDYYAV